MALPSYVVWFRGKPACPCLARWLPVFEAELIRLGMVRESIDIYQLIGGAEASGGTHALGGAFDIVQRDPVTIWVARQMGADATWARLTMDPQHAHGVLRGCPHNGPARYQIDEVDNGGDGLVGGAPDTGPRPLSGRTWRQGIAWAKEQGELKMDEKVKARFDAIDKRLAGLDDSLASLRQKEAQRFVKVIREQRKAGRDLEDILADLERN